MLRPTYAQLIPRLPRQAQPIYPKDVGPLLLWGDIGPGHRVVEIGTGPAALTLALLRAVGPTGQLVSYEVREDFAAIARDNVARHHGPAPNWTLRVADACAGIVERGVDRAVVDLAEPWQLLDHLAAALRPGGVLTAFVPTVLQVKEHVDALRAHERFDAVEALETLLRFWHVSGRSVRPGASHGRPHGLSRRRATHRRHRPGGFRIDSLEPLWYREVGRQPHRRVDAR